METIKSILIFIGVLIAVLGAGGLVIVIAALAPIIGFVLGTLIVTVLITGLVVADRDDSKKGT
jgi:hypothetical protein